MTYFWYKYRPVYAQGPHDWKFIKTHYNMRIVREVILEDGNVNIFSKDFIGVDIKKVAKPPIEVIKQTIGLVVETIGRSEKYLAGLQNDLNKASRKRSPSKKLKSDKKLAKALAAR